MKKLALFLLSIPCLAMGMNSSLAKLKSLVFQQSVFTISYLQLDSNFFVLHDKAFKHMHELNSGLNLSTMHYFEAKMRELQGNGSQYLQTIKQEIQNSIVRLGDRNTQRPIMENHILLIDKVLNGPDIKKIDNYLAIKALAQEGKVDQAAILLDIYKRMYGEIDSSAELYAYISSINTTQVDARQSQPVSSSQNRDMKIGELPQDSLGQKFSHFLGIFHSGDSGASALPGYQNSDNHGASANISTNASNTSTHYPHKSVQHMSHVYQVLYDAGDIGALQAKLKKCTQDEKAQLDYLLSTPVMKLLAMVQTGSVAEAKSAIQKIHAGCQANNFKQEHYQAGLELLKARGDYKGFISDLIETHDNRLVAQPVTTSATADTRDLVSTPAHPVADISKEVDIKIQEALNDLKDQYSDFQQYMHAVGSILQDMKNQGLLTPTSQAVLTPEVLEAIAHGAKHFVKEFKVENSAEFAQAVVKYGVCATFHIITDGAFLGAEKLALIGTQVHALFQTDFGSMNAKQKAEFIAERVADIIKTVLADQVGRKIIPKAKLGGLSSHSSSTSSTREVHEAVTPEGVNIKTSHQEQGGLVLKKSLNEINNHGRLVQRFKPLGRGSTGRSLPENLNEQLALAEVLSDPYRGKEIRITKGMTDIRWPASEGWIKMAWNNEKVEIHYVGQWKDGIIVAIDDLKFKQD